MIDREHTVAEEFVGERSRRSIPGDDDTDLIVLSLFTASAVLVGVGVITQLAPAWIAGAAAFVATFVVDRRRRSSSR